MKPFQEEQPLEASWMVTFSDVALLMLVFFVMRFSMLSISDSTVAARLKWVRASEKIEAELGMPRAAKRPENKAFDIIWTDLAAILGPPSQNGDVLTFNDWIKLSRQEALSRITLSGPFTSDTQLSFRAKAVVHALAKVAADEGLAIDVAVSSYQGPKSEAAFASSWERSRAQTLTVVRQMLDAGADLGRISVYAGQFKPDSGGLYRRSSSELEISLKPLAPKVHQIEEQLSDSSKAAQPQGT